MQLLCSNTFWERYERGLAENQNLHNLFEVSVVKGNECVVWLGRQIRAAGPQPDVYEGGCAAVWRAFWKQGATWSAKGVPVGVKRTLLDRCVLLALLVAGQGGNAHKACEMRIRGLLRKMVACVLELRPGAAESAETFGRRRNRCVTYWANYGADWVLETRRAELQFWCACGTKELARAAICWHGYGARCEMRG